MSDPHGWLGFWELYRSGDWEPSTRVWIESTVTPGSMFVDIGAWIGPVALWAMSQGANVVCVEPDPIAYAELVQRVPSQRCYRGAITPRGGMRTIIANPKKGGAFGDSMTRLGTGRHAEESSRLVETVSIGGLMQFRQRPDVVKVDVEGYELTLAPSLVRWCRQAGVRSMQISCHGDLLPAHIFHEWPLVEWPEDPHGDIRCYA